jgi:Pentapeptide repeats (8 copies)
LSATAVQAWIGVIATLFTAITGLYLGYKNKRDRIASVGNAFTTTVHDLSADNEVKCMAAAVLLRRFFDPDSEQAIRGMGIPYKKRTPYKKEAVEVIAGMLRRETEPSAEPSRLQKVLADGLRYAEDLRHSDLQYCVLSNAYLGKRDGDAASVDLSFADLYRAICVGTSFKYAKAVETVFYGATLDNAVFSGADCRGANFRDATLTGANFRDAELSKADFTGATIGRANFAGAHNIPREVAGLLDANGVAADSSVVPTPIENP